MKVLGLITFILLTKNIYADTHLKQHIFDKVIYNSNNTLKISKSNFSYKYSNNYILNVDPNGIESITYEPSKYLVDSTQCSQYPKTMHGKNSSDVTYGSYGPLYKGGINNLNSKYIHFTGKKGAYPSFTPTFSFINPQLMVAPVFGQKQTSFFLIDPNKDKILDSIILPGRNLRTLSLIGKGRHKQFQNTAGGTYFDIYENKVFVPIENKEDGSSKFQIWILKSIKDNETYKWDYLQTEVIDITKTFAKDSNFSNEKLGSPIALSVDTLGNIWIVFRNSFVACFHYNPICKQYKTVNIISIEENFETLNQVKLNYSELLKDSDKNSKTYRKEYLSILLEKFKGKYNFNYESIIEKSELKEQIQNSITFAEDKIFLVTNFALYGFYLRNDSILTLWDKDKYLSSHPNSLIYNNKYLHLPGHLNVGSGTTPTFFSNNGNNFISICDNDFPRINLNVYPLPNNKIESDSVFKRSLFTNAGSACENSVIAVTQNLVNNEQRFEEDQLTYLFVGNTFGYDKALVPREKNTVGGLTCYKFSKDSTGYYLVNKWFNYSVDVKTATPKLAIGTKTRIGNLYAYKKEKPLNSNKRNYLWQVSAINYETGLERFSYTVTPKSMNKFRKEDDFWSMFKLYTLFNRRTKEQVMSNIWGTYTYVDTNKIYIGTIRGILIIESK